MRVEHDVKLTFDDVLIRPKRSTLVSRSDVTLVREFKFRHSDTTWEGVPVGPMGPLGLLGDPWAPKEHPIGPACPPATGWPPAGDQPETGR